MKYRRATIVADDWHGEFGSYDEWARLGPQPPYRTATFIDAHGRRCITQRDFAQARDDRAFPVRYRWERPKPHKHPWPTKHHREDHRLSLGERQVIVILTDPALIDRISPDGGRIEITSR